MNEQDELGETLKLYRAGLISGEELLSLFQSEQNKTLERIKGKVAKACEFESDGAVHSCYNGCDGEVRHCKKCHGNICSNPACPNGKAETKYNKGHNDCHDAFTQAINEEKR